MEHFTISILLIIFSIFSLADGGTIGVNYGRIASNLPPPSHVVKLIKSQRLQKVKVYDTDPEVLQALSGSGFRVTVNLPNELLHNAANNKSFAFSWVQNNVVAYRSSVEAIAVGNEVFVSPINATDSLVPAMENIHAALVKHNLHNAIKVSSPVALSALSNSYPPSAGCFQHELIDRVVKPMLNFLRSSGSYLMVNAYPFFAYKSNTDVISLDYALFRDNPGVVDSGNGFRYFNLFDAQMDAVFAAMSALKYDDVSIVVSETGWPSQGGNSEVGASVQNAATYNGNLVRRVLTGGGTPLRPGAKLTVYLFALFNEKDKPGPTSEKNFGLFYPNQTKVYDIPLTKEGLKNYPENRSPVNGHPRVSRGGVLEKSWCVADTTAGKDKLQAGLDYACGEGAVDCSMIQPGATCYDPNTLEAHASFAFNSYYQKNNRIVGTCNFNGAAYTVTNQPEFGNCTLPTEY